jgi:hypothetical protein
MEQGPTEHSEQEERGRVLGDEWLDWQGDGSEEEIREGKRTFLIFSLVVLVGFILIVFLLWYLVLPRFEMYGRVYALALTWFILALSAFFVLWYAMLIVAVLSTGSYLNVCLRNRPNLFFALYPFTMKLAKTFGISRDRLSHSFIKVSNKLVRTASGRGNVLALIPRCLRKDLKQRIKEICADFPQVVVYTAPGGNVARKIINETCPKAIVAVACERDLVSGIKDIAPKIPVIGIPNTRPVGPCKDTAIDLGAFRSALEFFCNIS